MKLKDKDISKFQLCEGENIKLLQKDKEVFISAPSINKTTLKVGDFVISGNVVEVIAGRNVVLTTAHPNQLTIGADLDKEKATILRLEQRIENLERMIVKLLKDKE